jgi:hypothetical protein
MAELIDLGKLRFDFKGAYSAGTTYERNDVVIYQGSAYVYKNASAASGNAPTNTTYWDKMSQGINIGGGDSGKLLTNNGTDYQWTATPEVTTLTTVTDLTVGDQAFVGSGAAAFAATLTNPKAVIKTSATDYAQVAFQNVGDTADASTDFIAYANNGTDAAGWIDMGITAASFNDPSFTITGPHDGYIFMEAPSGTSGDGNLVLATGSNGAQNKIIFAAGGLSSDNTQMIIVPDQNVHIEIPTPSTSPTTGALTVVGGVGIQGDVNIQGTITFGGAGTTVETDNLSVSEPMIFVANGNPGNALDLGIVGEAYVTTTLDPVASITTKAITSNVATLGVTYGGGVEPVQVGDTIVVTGVDATFNGTYTVTARTNSTVSYAKTNANITQTAATSSLVRTVTTKALTSNIATLTTDVTHTFIAGEQVVVAGVDATFDGTYTILATPSTTTFTYAKTASDVGSTASGGGTATVAKLLGAVNATDVSRTRYAGFVKDASDGKWKLFDGITSKPTTTINFGQAGITYGTVRVGTVEADTAVLINGSPAATEAFVNNQLGLSWQVKTANYTLASGDNIFADSTAGSFTLTLPSSPAANTRVRIHDVAGKWNSFPVILARNGQLIQGVAENLNLNVQYGTVELFYAGASYGWRVV